MAATPADRIFNVARPPSRVFESFPDPVAPSAVPPSRIFTVWPVSRVFRIEAAPSRILEV